jgi:hypothetical protein
MAEEVKEAAGEEGEEEIIEKKPSAPTATILLILSAIFIGLATYVTGDELSYYFRPVDYENDYGSDWYYDQFERRDKKRAETVEEGARPGAPGAGGG